MVWAVGYGGMLNTGTHVIDAVLQFLGDPEPCWVMGQTERQTDRYCRGYICEDRSVAQIGFDNDVRLSLEMDIPRPPTDKFGIKIYGTRGVMEVDWERGATVHGVNGTTEYYPPPVDDVFAEYVEALVDVINGDRPSHPCEGPVAATTVETMMGIYESTRQHGMVEFPLRIKANPLEVMAETGELPVEYPGRYDIRHPPHRVPTE